MKVSVCIPVYGVEKYIERCARSLFEQTMTEDIEFIFVDDGTPDRSVEVLQSVLKEYPERKAQTVILHHAENRGLTGARNTAIRAACGDYIICCDSDDRVDPPLYETMYRAALEKQADIVCCAMVIETGSPNPRRLCLEGDSVDELFFGFFNSVAFNSVCNKMFAREIVLDQRNAAPDHIMMAEDLLRTTQMLLKCRDIAICNEVAYHYFCDNSASLTANFSLKAFGSLREVVDILSRVLPEKYDKIAESCRGQLLFSALRVPEVTKAEFRGMCPRGFIRRIAFNRHLSLGKRLLLVLSPISFSLARFLCVKLISLAQRMHVK